MKPFNVEVNFQTGDLTPGKKIDRYLSGVKNMFFDQAAADAILQREDPLIYQVIYADVPEAKGHLGNCTTIIYPGKVGREFYFTKGHFHEERGTAEIYFCLQGKGKLLLESTDGEWAILDMYPGTASYIPPYWSHRTINVGQEKLIFYCVFPADAGHDYGTIEEIGYPKLVVEENGQIMVVDNPKRRK
ncbi:MAG: glucose-6-phosphate isomerase, archaeal [Candidatus Atribacteria bacterium]|nr:glucose-6-phosphate isomerase, archaeal [Candidatus Atribacteria bacterium]